VITADRSSFVTAIVTAALAFAAAAALSGLAGGGKAAASVSGPGSITAAHAVVSGTELTILFDGKLYGALGEREAELTFGDEPPDVEGEDGDIMSEGGTSSISLRVAERARLPLTVETNWPSTCVRFMVAGTATPRVAKVLVVRADGSRTPIRLRVPPPGWKYEGHYYGALVRPVPAPRSIRAFDRVGRLVHSARLPHACVPG
jgi:hypothetical protein